MDMLMKIREDLRRMLQDESKDVGGVCRNFNRGIQTGIDIVDIYLNAYFNGMPANYPKEVSSGKV